MIGSRLGPYEITAKLGEGGMGEVYRATDTKLKRDVAIKVLPAAFTEDKERLARFEREAQVLAQLHHPNIASIFGMEESDGTRALVMELVEGPTLAERLEAGPFSFHECLSVSVQIAHALEEAHEKGIVHRDLKPQNIKASMEGRTKVLDFGLAKAMDPSVGSAASAADLARSPTLMQSPTLTAAHGTQLGVILGTAAYMAPEQAKGLPIDKRADIWAFGVVMFEMLVGRSLFAGETVTDTLAGVLKTEIDFSMLPASTPPAMRRLLRRLLERNPKNRLHDIADARIVLEEPLAGKLDEPASGASVMGVEAPPPARRAHLAILAAGLVALGAVGGWLVSRSVAPSSAASTEILRPSFRQLTKAPGGERSPTLAPDGESFVFVARDGGDLDLFVQRVDGRKAIALTADCELDDFDPAFSPDGRSIAFRSECGGGGTFVMGATGESTRRVTDFGFQAAWSPDGKELALVTERLESPNSRNSASALWTVRIESGERRKVSDHDAMGPTWSPDGKRIAFWGLRGTGFQRDLWSVSADGSAPGAEAARGLTDDAAVDWAPVHSKDGRWLWYASTRGGTFNIWRLPIDFENGEPTGEPQPVTAPSSSAGPFALSADGRRLVFTDRNLDTRIVRAPFDAARGELGGPPATAFSGSFELREQKMSPDGEWLLFANEDLPQHLHVVRPGGGGYRQLTDGDDRNRQGDWSPKMDWIVFQTSRGASTLGAMRPDGGGWQSIPVPRGVSTPRWSPDGTSISVFDYGNGGGHLVDVRAGLSKPELRLLPPIAEGVLFWPTAWSSDGALLAGRATRAGQIGEIVVRTNTTGEYRSLPGTEGATNDHNLTFVGARTLVYTDDWALWIRDAFGGDSKLLYRPLAGQRVESVSSTADGGWLSWIEKADESDIWLMTLEGGDGESSKAGSGK